MTGRHRKKRAVSLVATDLDLMPMINVFMAIIPMLLLSAAFVPVTVIRTAVPSDGAPVAASNAPLEIAVAIRASAYVVTVDGRAVRSIDRAAADPAAALTGALQEVASAHPGHREVRILSRAGTRYEEIIQVMDSARAAGLSESALADAGEAP